MTAIEHMQQAYRNHFQSDPAFIVRAPGRVNLIGEHTDYNEGFVLPMTLDRAVWIALSPHPTATLELLALDFDERIQFDLGAFKRGQHSVAEHVKGVAWALAASGRGLQGWQGVMSGDVPIGSGLSSSAALQLAVARAFACVGTWAWEPVAMAQIAQHAENGWLGLQTGIMDQLISATGKADHAILIDCRSLALDELPLPSDCAVVILDTNTRRQLVGSEYNERRAQCQMAARHFEVAALRDVRLSQLQAEQAQLDALVYRRARHVISENARVLEARQALLAGDIVHLGTLFNASHASLRDDFEVTNDALNVIVTAAQNHPACYGARMTGAGFGGCAVALVDPTASVDFMAQVAERYAQHTSQTATLYLAHASNGASVEYAVT